jgi:hypothetical protein
MSDTRIDPTRPQFDAFKALPRDTPIEMLNLVAFRQDAAYPPEHPRHGGGLSGPRPTPSTASKAIRCSHAWAARSSGADGWRRC